MITISEDKKLLVHKAYHLLLCLLVFVLPYDNPRLYSIIIILSFSAHLISGEFTKGIKRIWKNKIFLLFISPFIFYLIGMTYTSNWDAGLSELEVKLPILAMPLLLFTSSTITKKIQSYVLYSFVFGIITFLIYRTIFVSMSNEDINITLFTHTNLSGTHPSFVSIFTVFAIVILINNLLNNVESKNKWLHFFLIIILSIAVVFLNSKAGIIIFFVSCSACLLLNRLKKKLKYVITWLISIIFITIMIFSIEKVRNRIIQSPLKALKQGLEVNPYNQDTWPITFRLQAWDCSLDIISSNIVFGQGTGDAHDELLKCYKEKKYSRVIIRNLDSHSEYLSTTLKGGIIALFILLACYIYPFIGAKTRRGNELYFSFLVIIFIFGLSDNLLGVSKGVVFYSFFNTLLAIDFINNE